MSTRLGLAVVGVACVVAAGAGGYLATRHASQPVTAAAAVSAPLTPAPVQETEAAIDDPKPAAAPTVDSTPGVPVADASLAQPVSPEAPPATTPVNAPAPARRAPAAAPRSPRVAAPERSSQEPARRTTIDEPADRSAQGPGAASAMPEPVDPLPAPEVAHRAEPVDPPREPEPRLEELVVPSDSVIGLQIESTISSETARVEDRVDARVTRDVAVGGRVAVPAGTRVQGSVALVDRGGRMKERARLGVRFHTLVLADGTTLPLQTETVFREGESPSSSSSAKIGGAAIGGALLGAIIGGARGAVIGGTTGAAGGTAAVMASGRKAATLGAGSTMTVRVLSPISVTVERD